MSKTKTKGATVLASEKWGSPQDIKMTPLEKEAKDTADAIRQRQSPKGAFGLPELLDARRLKYAIPDGAFQRCSVYDRILVWQIPSDEGETFGDTMIIMPETSKVKARESAPRGIIVSAGLLALDHLRSNGMDLGHIVNFVIQAPWRLQIDTVNGHPFFLLILRDGDLIASEDLQYALKNGECTITNNNQNQHIFTDKQGKQWQPQLPFIPEDY